MKQVLIIDASSLFREFLKEKLTAEHIAVEISEGKRDAFTKLISLLPDLVILDISDSINSTTEFLTKRLKDPNAKNIPLIIAGPEIDNDEIPRLAQFGFFKYFTKPIKFDILFESIGKVLKTKFAIDTTPCMLGIHKNQNILFIEIAQGLNREKITILKYKIPEILDSTHLETPKVLLMMTGLDLSFIDGANIELLFDNILEDSRIHRKNVKVLSLSSFVRQMIAGHKEYEGIEVAKDLSQVLNSLIDSRPTQSITDLISDNILASTNLDDTGSVEMRFRSDSESENSSTDKYSIAVLDSDNAVRNVLKEAFSEINAVCYEFSSGTEFLASLNTQKYDLLILELYLPDINGFDVIKRLRAIKNAPPFIVYSSATQRQLVIQAMGLGAKTYFIKPQNPKIITGKAMEVINGET